MTMREAFEKFAKEKFFVLDQGPDGDYTSFPTVMGWAFWQAAYAVGMTRAAEIVEGRRDLRRGAEYVCNAHVAGCADAIRAEITKGAE
jgi:hypothetical protein